MHKIIFSNNKVFFALLLLSHFAFSQAYNFRNYSVKDGVAQSHLLNTKFIKEFVKTDGGYLRMNDGFNVPVSERKKAEVIKMLEEL